MRIPPREHIRHDESDERSSEHAEVGEQTRRFRRLLRFDRYWCSGGEEWLSLEVGGERVGEEELWMASSFVAIVEN